MRLKSARDLKDHLLNELRTLPQLESYSEPHGQSFGAERAGPLLPLGIALGIAPTKDSAFLLAVRVQRIDPATNAIVAHVNKEASGETDVRMLGTVEAQCQCGPLASGLSAAHPEVGAGTIGPFVSLDGDPDLFALSNNHVFAHCNQGQIGDAIQHPSVNDRALHEYDRIGVLAHSVDLLTDQPNAVDAAICRVDAGIDCDPRIDGVTPTDAGDIDAGLAVEKIGRTTARTHGIITAFDMDGVTVHYQGLGRLVFDGQIEVRSDEEGSRPFSERGDSRSLVFHSASKNAIGLLFAGGRPFTGNTGYATFVSPIRVVLGHLQATLVA